MKDTKFSIALPNGKDEKNIAKLIRWALKELPSDNAIQIDQFLLEHSYTSDGKPTISVDYDLLDENMINLRNQSIKDATLVDGDVPEVEYALDPYERLLLTV